MKSGPVKTASSSVFSPSHPTSQELLLSILPSLLYPLHSFPTYPLLSSIPVVWKWNKNLPSSPTFEIISVILFSIKTHNLHSPHSVLILCILASVSHVSPTHKALPKVTSGSGNTQTRASSQLPPSEDFRLLLSLLDPLLWISWLYPPLPSLKTTLSKPLHLWKSLSVQLLLFSPPPLDVSVPRSHKLPTSDPGCHAGNSDIT